MVVKSKELKLEVAAHGLSKISSKEDWVSSSLFFSLILESSL